MIDEQKTEEPVEDATQDRNELKSRRDFVMDIAERIFLPENEVVLDKVLAAIMKKGDLDVTMEKYVDRNFGQLISSFPILQRRYIEIAKEGTVASRKRRRRVKGKR